MSLPHWKTKNPNTDKKTKNHNFGGHKKVLINKLIKNIKIYCKKYIISIK